MSKILGLGGYLREWFLSCLTQSTDGTGILWMPRDYRKQESSAASGNAKEFIIRQTEPGTAHSDWKKRLDSWFLTRGIKEKSGTCVKYSIFVGISASPDSAHSGH